MSNIASSSTSAPNVPEFNLPTIDDVKGWNTEQLIGFLREKLKNVDDKYINTIKDQLVDGEDFLNCTAVDFERWGVLGGPAKKFESLIKDIRGEEGFNNIVELIKALQADKEAVKTILSEERSPEHHIVINHFLSKPLALIEKPTIFVRKPYEDLYRLIINKTSKGSKHKFLVSGTSGIGKSCFLVYFLIRHLCEFENATIIFQTIQSDDFYCFEGLNLSSRSYNNFLTHFQSSETWYLADGIISPRLVSAKTLIALSPKGFVNDKFQVIEKDIVQKFYMSPWSLDELLGCREKVFPNVPEDIVVALYNKAGGVPRYVFRRAEISLQYFNYDPKTPDEKEIIIKQAFDRVEYALLQVKNFSDLILCFTENAYFIQYSSRLVHQWSNPSYNSYHLQWASRYIYNEIEKRVMDLTF
ncbi:hypothetical protein RclHR1_06720006 [Rhizophagus clarus]|uniref:SAM domain-containing protein n=1 Tax=Rhizophagus clarus TaxID=94130 RepID=A0A2Z6S9R7_9GLOM|nr:hypothetical protein RclHR1_06720006 [Rhizophagus clarus]